MEWLTLLKQKPTMAGTSFFPKSCLFSGEVGIHTHASEQKDRCLGHLAYNSVLPSLLSQEDLAKMLDSCSVEDYNEIFWVQLH